MSLMRAISLPSRAEDMLAANACESPRVNEQLHHLHHQDCAVKLEASCMNLWVWWQCCVCLASAEELMLHANATWSSLSDSRPARFVLEALWGRLRKPGAAQLVSCLTTQMSHKWLNSPAHWLRLMSHNPPNLPPLLLSCTPTLGASFYDHQFTYKCNYKVIKRVMWERQAGVMTGSRIRAACFQKDPEELDFNSTFVLFLLAGREQLTAQEL